MRVLGIETSCDETAAAVVDDGHLVRANVVSSQIARHAVYGGVVPELAAREHLRAMEPVVSAALSEAGCAVGDLDALAVTVHPGLVPALLVGVSYARGLAAARDLPCVPINHFLAHIYGAFLGDPERLGPGSFPALALVVSGGHTALLRVDVDGSSHLLGQTLDDAAGEAFDKAAKILGLGYPGGPVIDRLAAEGDPGAFPFPRGLVGGQGRRVRDEDRFNFSFSGVKTSLLYRLPEGRPPEGQELRDLVASYQGAIVDVLAEKAVDAAIHTGAATLVLCGGVACNSALRREVAARAGAQGVDVVIAPPRYCTDNAAMVAGLAWHYLRHDVRGSDQVGARLPAEAARVPFAPGFQRGVSVSR